MSSSRAWPAGPYSQVLTNYGVLQTCIPLFDLKGPGGSSLGFSIYNRTMQAGVNQGLPPDQNTLTTGGVGLGWEASVFSSAGTGNVPGGATGWFQSFTGNSLSFWTDPNGFNGQNIPIGSFTRTPGTRADLSFNTSGGSVSGYDVIDQATKSDYNYSQPVTPNAPSSYYLSKITDTHGNVTTYSYAPASTGLLYLPTQVTDPSGRYYTINYGTIQGNESFPTNANPQILSVVLTCPASATNPTTVTREWDFNYNNDIVLAGPELTSITFPPTVANGSRPTLNFVYDDCTNLTSLTDFNGNIWQYTYGVAFPISEGNSPPVTQIAIASVVNPANGENTNSNQLTTSFSYGSDWTEVDGTYFSKDHVCTVTDQLGNNYAYTYYADAGDTSSNLPSPIKTVQDPESYTEAYTWNLGDCTLAKCTDKLGNPWNFTYDTTNHGLMLSKQDPLGNTTSYSYDDSLPTSSDKLIQTVDPANSTTTYAYDSALDLITSNVDSTGVALITNNTYTTAGELLTTYKGSDASTTYAYDTYGNATTVTPPSGNPSRFTYDAFNNKLSDTEPSPEGETTYNYDLWNRLVQVNNPDSTTTTKAYDNNGNVVQDTNELNITTTITYDALNRPIKTDQPIDLGTNGVIYVLGQPNPDDIVVNVAYDAAGNRTSVQNGNGNFTNYAFDSRHELTKTTYPDGEIRQSAYDADGNVISTSDHTGTGNTTYAYDADNRLVTTTFSNSSTGPYTNTWRNDGVRTKLTDPTGSTTWTVNGAKQITQVTEPYAGATLNYTYDTSGRKKTLQVSMPSATPASAQTWTYDYDSALRPEDIEQSVGDSKPVTFAYNPNSSIFTETQGTAGSLTTTYAYDTCGRTTGIVNDLSGVQQQQTAYSYDKAGNVTIYQDTIGAGSPMTTTYAYDFANRLTLETRIGGPSSAAYSNSYEYDKDGNRKSVTRNSNPASAYSVDSNDKFLSGDGYSVSESAYDSHGDPTSLQSCTSGGGYQFQYDLEDRPILLTMPGGYAVSYTIDGDGHRIGKTVSGQTTKYVYDGDTVVAEIAPTGTVTYEVPGVGYVTGAVQSYYQDNAQGSTLSVQSETGTMQSQNEYDGYGINYPLVTGPHSDLGYVGSKGYVTDNESGLLELGHRYYLPILGRFLTQDPIGQKDDLNLYAYCKDNPISNIDPDGDSGYNPQLVNKLIRSILNLRIKIQQRTGELREDKLDLPERAPGDELNPSLSRWGHRLLINNDINSLDKLKAELDKEVTKGDPPPPSKFQSWISGVSDSDYVWGTVLLIGAVATGGSLLLPEAATTGGTVGTAVAVRTLAACH